MCHVSGPKQWPLQDPQVMLSYLGMDLKNLQVVCLAFLIH